MRFVSSCRCLFRQQPSQITTAEAGGSGAEESVWQPGPRRVCRIDEVSDLRNATGPLFPPREGLQLKKPCSMFRTVRKICYRTRAQALAGVMWRRAADVSVMFNQSFLQTE